MATRQRRLEIVIAWMQQHPGVVKNVQSNLQSLAGSYGFLRKNIGQLNLTANEQAEFMKQLTTTYEEMRVRAGASAQTVNMLNKALSATTSEMNKASKATAQLARANATLAAKQMKAATKAANQLAAKMTAGAKPAEDLREKMLELGMSYRFLLNNANKLGLSAEEQQKYTENLTEAFKNMKNASQMGATTSAMHNKALSATTKEMSKTTKAGGIFNAIMQRMGYRTAWMGFRMAIMGRMITRTVLQPMQKMIGILVGWEKSMESTALALALQEAGMGETGMSAEELRQTMMDLAEEGPKTQTAFEGLKVTWADLATKNAPELNRILGTIQEALKGVGGEIITSMVDTIADAVPAVGDFLDSLEPFSGVIGTLSGYLLIAGGAMTALGTAIYLMRPAMLVLRAALNPTLLLILGLVIAVNELRKGLKALGGGKWWEEPVPGVDPGLPGPGMAAGFRLDKWLGDMWDAAFANIKVERGVDPSKGLDRTYPSEVRQEMDIDINLDIENLLSDIDVDAMAVTLSDAVAEALRLRGYP